MSNEFYARIAATLQEIEEQGLWKPERLITSPQGAKVTVKTDAGTVEALNFCANNYLGLADNAQLSKAQAETNAHASTGC